MTTNGTSPHPSNRSLRRRLANAFVAGAGTGFVAGGFLICAIVWQYGNFVGSRAANRAHPPATPSAIERLIGGGGIDDAGAPVIDGAPVATPVATTGEPAPVVTPPPSPEPVVGAVPARELADRDLMIPVEGVRTEQLVRSFGDRRGGSRSHEAIDILAPMRTPVVAVEGGTIARLFYSKAGGITIYQFDPTERYCYYYAHLDRYAEGLREGGKVARGQIIGYVGVSGNAPKNTPHLHFAVFRLTEAKRWWEGSPIDPYDILR
jgi:murein DD-endopeptidase MepM/ murein hydrolase activator NlpD